MRVDAGGAHSVDRCVHVRLRVRLGLQRVHVGDLMRGLLLAMRMVRCSDTDVSVLGAHDFDLDFPC